MNSTLAEENVALGCISASPTHYLFEYLFCYINFVINHIRNNVKQEARYNLGYH